MNGTPARRPKSAFSETGVRIKEVSEGRPCDNCPELCPGFIPHAWRKTCTSCGCDRLQHSVYHEELGSVRDRLGLSPTAVTPGSYDAAAPPTLTAKQSELYWAALAERSPTGIGGATGTAAWRAWRTRALASQLPKQDLSLSHCRHVDEAHRKQYEDFVAARNEIALDIGIAGQHHGASIECMGCAKPIRSGNIYVQAPRIGEDAYYHPGCFSCAECDELLVELAYCSLDGRPLCVRHYAERLKPRCHSCDELFKSCPGVIPLHPPRSLENPLEVPCPYPFLFMTECLFGTIEMGLVLSAVISYAGINEANECLRHILSGVVPETEPNFEDLVEYYTKLLRQQATTSEDWITACGQGYLSLTEDSVGRLKSSVKYYHGEPDSTAILFSTKISSFGDSVEDAPQANGDYRTERYSPSVTKTIVSNTSDSFSIANRNKSPDPDQNSPAESFERIPSTNASDERTEKTEEKLTWKYTPLSPTPEIQFQSYDDDKPGLTDDYLRSLDGIKYRPLQRSDPSGRRRSFKKRRSSSSTSSRESRASREEELKIFTSLEEAELSLKTGNDNVDAYGSAPNLSGRSDSRSRSASREPRNESWSMEASLDADEDPLKNSTKPNADEDKTKEVIEEEDDLDDFWGNSG